MSHLTIKSALAITCILVFSINVYSDIRGIYWNDILEDNSVPYDVKVTALDSLLACNPDQKIQLLHKKAYLQQQETRYGDLIGTYSELWKISKKSGVRAKTEILSGWTHALLNNGQFSDGEQKGVEMLRIDKPDSLRILDADAYISFAFSKMELGMPDAAKKDIESADSIIRKYRRSSRAEDALKTEIALLRIKATYFTEKNELQKAIHHLKHGLALCKDSLTKINLDGYLADIYRMASENAIAEQYYRKVLSFPGKWHNKSVSLNNYMDLLNSEGRYEESLSVYDSCASSIPANVTDVLSTNIMANRAVALGGVGRYREAFEMMTDAKVKRDSLNREFLSNNKFAVHDLEVVVAERERVAKDSQQTKNALLATILIAAILAGCIVALMIKVKRTKKQNLSMSERLRTIESEHRSVICNREETIGEQSRELISYTLQLAQVNELIDEILGITRRKECSDSQRIKQIQERVRQHGIQDNMWEAFQNYFKKIHPDFFTTLYEYHPSLSVNEVKNMKN